MRRGRALPASVPPATADSVSSLVAPPLGAGVDAVEEEEEEEQSYHLNNLEQK